MILDPYQIQDLFMIGLDLVTQRYVPVRTRQGYINSADPQKPARAALD